MLSAGVNALQGNYLNATSDSGEALTYIPSIVSNGVSGSYKTAKSLLPFLPSAIVGGTSLMAAKKFA